MLPLKKKIAWLTLFSVAMGFMESAVVIYLRKIYYPAGFEFPLVPIEPQIAVVEFLREAATIIMLAGISILVGRTRSEKFGCFLFCFAVWDIFYYVFLKLFLGWPVSWLTWDILFLIPVPWVGPVLAPCIVALSLAAWGLAICIANEKEYDARIRISELTLFVTGGLVIIFSFTYDYLCYLGRTRTSPWSPQSSEALFSEISQYVPENYSWLLFAAGQALVMASILIHSVKTFKRKAICSSYTG